MSIATFRVLTPAGRVAAISTLCLTAALILGQADHALAGPNAYGTLIAHFTGLAYTDGSTSYPSTPPSCDPNTVVNQWGLDVNTVWKVYAAFPSNGSPRLRALTMGSEFPPPVVVLAAGLPDPMADFEMAQGGWPTESGGGVGIIFGAVQTALVDECYWFGGYGYGAGGTWCIAPHPMESMVFHDDSVPPQEDAIVALSCIGFGVPGDTHCPTGPPPYGACCLCTNECQVMSMAECMALGGLYWGDGTGCNPPPQCAFPPFGACCVNHVCTIEEPLQCGLMGGTYYCTDCDPNPCPPPTPLETSNWGRIKNAYR